MSEAPRKGSLLVIFLTVFIDLLGFGIVLPLLPIYGEDFAGQYELNDRQVGWLIGLLMSSFSAMQFLFLPVWGRLSDRFGRRPIIIIGLTASTFFYAMFGVAAMFRSLPWLFATRIGAGIAGAGLHCRHDQQGGTGQRHGPDRRRLCAWIYAGADAQYGRLVSRPPHCREPVARLRGLSHVGGRPGAGSF
jgi:MFS family permease